MEYIISMNMDIERYYDLFCTSEPASIHTSHYACSHGSKLFTSLTKLSLVVGSVPRGVNSFKLANIGALLKTNLSWTLFGNNGLSKPTKACRIKGRLRIIVGPARLGYRLS
jgi:hypothetical protein